MNADVKTSLLTRLSETHTATREILNEVDLEICVFSDTNWRIRDILGHIATWDRVLANALKAYIDGSQCVVILDWDKEEVVKNIKKVLFVFSIIATLTAILIKSLIISAYIFVAFYIVIAIPVLATWIKKSIKQTTLITSFIFGIVGVIALLLYYSLVAGGITPTLVISAIGFSIVGLIIGGIISKVK